jgi:murein DD-endopeptidase MepM/ murein hydrolase activator NlpD
MLKISLFSILLVFNSSLLFSANVEQQKQLQNYADVTKWLIDNQSNIEELIKETAKASQTKWFVEPKATPQVAEPKKSVKLPEVNSEKYIKHTVEPKDTLFAISKKYNIKLDTIKKINNLEDENIKIGMILLVPNINNLPNNDEINTVVKSIEGEKQLEVKQKIADKPLEVKADRQVEPFDYQALLPEYKYYRVVAGDTLASIAKNNNMSKEELLALNNLTPNSILSVDLILKIKSNYKNNPNKTIDNDNFVWPVIGRLLIAYGPQSGGTINEGINIAAKKGTQVKVAQDGLITYVGQDIKGYGNIILVQHKNNWVSAYAHLDTVVVKKGQLVKGGSVIGTIGVSGGVSQPQLHFELRKDIKPMDPLNYLNSN